MFMLLQADIGFPRCYMKLLLFSVNLTSGKQVGTFQQSTEALCHGSVMPMECWDVSNPVAVAVQQLFASCTRHAHGTQSESAREDN